MNQASDEPVFMRNIFLHMHPLNVNTCTQCESELTVCTPRMKHSTCATTNTAGRARASLRVQMHTTTRDLSSSSSDHTKKGNQKNWFKPGIDKTRVSEVTSARSACSTHHDPEKTNICTALNTVTSLCEECDPGVRLTKEPGRRAHAQPRISSPPLTLPASSGGSRGPDN